MRTAGNTRRLATFCSSERRICRDEYEISYSVSVFHTGRNCLECFQAGRDGMAKMPLSDYVAMV